MVAVAACAALYALVLAIGRDPLPSLTSPQEPQLTPPAPPERLSPVPETNAPSPITDDDQKPEVRIAVLIHVTIPDGQVLPAGAGVATFDASTATDFRWHPIDSLTSGADGLSLSAEGIQGHTLTVTLAAERGDARHGYIARRDVACRRGADDAITTVVLSGRVTEVTFELPVDCERAGPLRLARHDDPMWGAMRQQHIGLTLSRGAKISMPLGDGDYELTDPLTGDHTQRFSVPAASRITIDAGLTPARDGHR